MRNKHERDATFEVGGTRLTTRLIEGEYPNYRNLIPPSYPNKVTMGRDALLEALRRVKILAREGTPVRLAVTRANGAVERREIPVDVWLAGARRYTLALDSPATIAKIEIDPENAFPDIDRSNNRWTAAAAR